MSIKDKLKLTLIGPSNPTPTSEDKETPTPVAAAEIPHPTATEADLPRRFRVEQPNMREVVFDCPWTGHVTTDILISLPKGIPLVGKLCFKCGAMVYTAIELSSVLGPDGKPMQTPPVTRKGD